MKTYVGEIKVMLHKAYNINSKTTKEAQWNKLHCQFDAGKINIYRYTFLT